MTRTLLLALSAMFLGGCAAQPAAPIAQVSHGISLATDPSLAIAPVPELARSNREPSAFYGVQESTTEFSSVYLYDDQQFQDSFGNYDRQAITQRVGVTYR